MLVLGLLLATAGCRTSETKNSMILSRHSDPLLSPAWPPLRFFFLSTSIHHPIPPTSTPHTDRPPVESLPHHPPSALRPANVAAPTHPCEIRPRRTLQIACSVAITPPTTHPAPTASYEVAHHQPTHSRKPYTVQSLCIRPTRTPLHSIRRLSSRSHFA